MFKILGEHIMIILMNGSAIFLNTSKTLEMNYKPVDMKIQMHVQNYRFMPKISVVNGNAYVATQRDLSFC